MKKIEHVVFVESNLKGLEALSVAKQMGYHVSLLRSPKYRSLYSIEGADSILKNIDRIIEIPDSFAEQDLHQALQKLNEEEKIDILISLVEYCILPLSRAASKLKIPYTSAEAVENASNKFKCRQILKLSGVASIKYKKVSISGSEDANDLRQSFLQGALEIGLPVVIKPVRSAGSLFAAIIQNESDLDDYIKSYQEQDEICGVKKEDLANGGFLIEEYMQGEMYSVDIGVNLADRIIFGIGERKRLRENEVIELGTCMPANVSAEKYTIMGQYAIDVVNALGLDLGIFHLEIIYTSEGPRLLEANPRMFGGNGPILISKSANINIFEYLIKIHAQEICPKLPAGPGKCVVSRVFGKMEEKMHPALPLLAWKEKYRSSLISFSIDQKKLASTGKIKSNFDYIGAFQVQADNAKQATQIADDILQDLSTELGIKLTT